MGKGEKWNNHEAHLCEIFLEILDFFEIKIRKDTSNETGYLMINRLNKKKSYLEIKRETKSPFLSIHVIEIDMGQTIL